MYDIRQFKPALYTLLVLGFSGFALATQTTGMWMLSTAMLLLNVWLIRTGRFSPMPRWMANIVTVGAVVYIVSEIRANTAVPIVLIGQFLVLLQLVKIYEQRANRDYAQLLVLSLLLIVAAAINTASLVFGGILIVYLFLSLYCCLLFHLKVETDHAKVALGVREDRINPATFRQDQRYLSSSMRRLTGLVSMVAIMLAVSVFLFFPRGAGANWLTPLQMRASASVGFSDEVSFQNIARIQQNNDVAARVRVLHNGKPVEGTMMLLLRGNVHTDYSGGTGSWKWSRSTQPEPPQIDVNPNAGTVQLPGRQSDELWYQEITLEPHGLTTLFSMPGPVAVGGSNELSRVRFYPRDDVLATSENVNSPLKYTVISTNAMYTPGPSDTAPSDARSRTIYDWRWLLSTFHSPVNARSSRPTADTGVRVGSHSVIDPKVAEMAQRPEVSGSDEKGPLAAQRDAKIRRPLPIDETIAENIEKYLRSNYSYTLDLTDARSIMEGGQDPMVSFLYDVKRGHCEYFAGAMTLMCQSLGMSARLVVGFKCDEYNAAGGYYMVRQSHAHAWVEVLTPEGWRTFDPTSANEAGASGAGSAWAKMKHYFDYLEFLWATTVIAYDRDSRDSMLQNLRNLDVRVTNSIINSRVDPRDMKRSVSSWLNEFFSEKNFLLFSSRILSGLIYLMFFALAGAIGGFIYERIKLRKRARRIGLESLPQQDLVRLARQLGFYDELLRLLARHRIERSRSQTPREFAESLAYLPAQAYDLVHRLTDLYYQIRYGGTELNATRRGKVHKALDEVEDILRVSVRRPY